MNHLDVCHNAPVLFSEPWEMSFVSFELFVKDTIDKMNDKQTHPYNLNLIGYSKEQYQQYPIKGYVYVGNGRINKVSQDEWTIEDFNEMRELALVSKANGMLNFQRAIVKAAWDQIKGKNPKKSKFSFFFR